jgi:hypothetical protein
MNLYGYARYRYGSFFDFAVYGTIDDGPVQAGEFIADDGFYGRQAVEGNLREEMVFGLELHSAHQQQPEEVLVSVVSAGLDLVVHEGHLWVLFEADLVLVVSDQDDG